MDQELKDALDKELKGYEKPGMTAREIAAERAKFDQEIYSLNFMEEDADLQDEFEIQDIIINEVTKTHQKKLIDHSQYDGNLNMDDDSRNGYIQAVLQLLRHSDPFVIYFMKQLYNFKAMPRTPKKKHLSIMLEDLFSQLFRATKQLEIDRETVDIKHYQTKLRGQFAPGKSHDAYKFLIHIFNVLTSETVDS